MVNVVVLTRLLRNVPVWPTLSWPHKHTPYACYAHALDCWHGVQGDWPLKQKRMEFNWITSSLPPPVCVYALITLLSDLKLVFTTTKSSNKLHTSRNMHHCGLLSSDKRLTTTTTGEPSMGTPPISSLSTGKNSSCRHQIQIQASHTHTQTPVHFPLTCCQQQPFPRHQWLTPRSFCVASHRILSAHTSDTSSSSAGASD